MNPWEPHLVTGLIVICGVIANYAILGERVRTNAENTAKLDAEFTAHKDSIWPVVTMQGQDIAKVKGHLGINGDYQRGGGHHQ
jgi:hypothetical protein